MLFALNRQIHEFARSRVLVLGFGIALALILLVAEDTARASTLELAREAYLAEQYGKAFAIYSSLAAQRNAEAEYRLGEMYHLGNGAPEDKVQALRWYRLAAAQGHAPAQTAVGYMYSFGEGGVRGDQEAVRWFRLAAEQGYARAQVRLGDMYESGRGVTKSIGEAIRWWRAAADVGDARAQSRLGDIYESRHDLAEAIRWFRMAAMQGEIGALSELQRLGAPHDSTAQTPPPENYHLTLDDVRVLIDGEGHEVIEIFFSGPVWVPPSPVYQPGSFRLSFSGTVSRVSKNLFQLKEQSTIEDYRVWSNDFDSELRVALRDFRLNLEGHIRFDWNGNGDVLRVVLLAVPFESASPPVAREEPPPVRASPAMPAPSQSPTSQGTGWPVAGGFVVTNFHVVEGNAAITLIRQDGVRIPARLVLKDEASDLALLRPADPSLLPPALPLASSAAGLGAEVFTIGFPLSPVMGTQPKLTTGIISALTGMRDDPRTFQISVPVQPGNSGGPLLNLRGEVVGIVSGKLNAAKIQELTGDIPQNVNYAIKAGLVRNLVESAGGANAPGTTSRVEQGTLEEVAARVKDSVLIVSLVACDALAFTWTDVKNTPEFQQAAPDHQQAIKQTYYQRYVASCGKTWEEWLQETHFGGR